MCCIFVVLVGMFMCCVCPPRTVFLSVHEVSVKVGSMALDMVPGGVGCRCFVRCCLILLRLVECRGKCGRVPALGMGRA